MIPQRYIEEWKLQAPWPNDAQVEQDLVIARALVELFSDDLLKKSLAFRGGTALHKLYLQPLIKMRLKIEINTREHFNVLGLKQIPYSVENSWFSGTCNLTGYELEELLGTKLRALYQRRKGRDLFD